MAVLTPFDPPQPPSLPHVKRWGGPDRIRKQMLVTTNMQQSQDRQEIHQPRHRPQWERWLSAIPAFRLQPRAVTPIKSGSHSKDTGQGGLLVTNSLT